jgi:hypothetical protein
MRRWRRKRYYIRHFEVAYGKVLSKAVMIGNMVVIFPDSNCILIREVCNSDSHSRLALSFSSICLDRLPKPPFDAKSVYLEPQPPRRSSFARRGSQINA